jgi:hypothetical protein
MNNLNPVGKPVEKSIRYSKKALEKNSEKVDANEIEVFSIIDESCVKRRELKEVKAFINKKNWFINYNKKSTAIYGLVCITIFVLVLNFHYLLFLKLVNPNERNESDAKQIIFRKNSMFKNTSLFMAIQEFSGEKLINPQEKICYASKVRIKLRIYMNLNYFIFFNVRVHFMTHFWRNIGFGSI